MDALENLVKNYQLSKAPFLPHSYGFPHSRELRFCGYSPQPQPSLG